MIITQTPFRMSFFGGGTDYPEFYKTHGGSVISTTFDKYCYVTVRHLPRFFDYSNHVVYAQIENVNAIDEIKHPAIRNAMKYLDIHEVSLIYDADLPARSGLGSSSSFAVGMLNSFYALKGKYASKEKLANDAIYVERIMCAEDGGVQDQIAASYGGFNRIDFTTDGFSVRPLVMSKERKQELDDNLMLFFTGFSRYSFDIAREQKKKTKDREHELLEMLKLVDEAENILTTKTSLKEFGRLLDYTWRLKRSITDKISNSKIDSIYETAKKAGAIGGKLMGAGGSGFMFFYVEKDQQEMVKQALDEFLYVPFGFENKGTSILYYSPEDYDPILNRENTEMINGGSL